MGGIFKAFFGGAPKANTAPAAETVTTEANKAKQARAQLYATDGGAAGSELAPAQVKKRDTLFGN